MGELREGGEEGGGQVSIPDLLAKLKADREKHFERFAPVLRGGSRCDCTQLLSLPWPCPTARALDCAIVLAEAAVLDAAEGHDDDCEHSLSSARALSAALRAYEGTHAEEE